MKLIIGNWQEAQIEVVKSMRGIHEREAWIQKAETGNAMLVVSIRQIFDK